MKFKPSLLKNKQNIHKHFPRLVITIFQISFQSTMMSRLNTPEKDQILDYRGQTLKGIRYLKNILKKKVAYLLRNFNLQIGVI